MEKKKLKAKATLALKSDDLLGLIESVTESVRAIGSFEKAMEKAGTQLVILSQELGCSPAQALLFIMTFGISFDLGGITVTDMAGFLKGSPMQMARHTRDLEELCGMLLLRRDRGERFRYGGRSTMPRYYVPSDVVESVCTGQKIERGSIEFESLEELVGVAGSLMDSALEQNNGMEEVFREVKALLLHNKQLEFSRVMLNTRINDDSFQIVIYMALQTLKGNPEARLENLLKTVFPDTNKQVYQRRYFKRGGHELQRKKILEFEPAAFRNEFIVKLSSKFAGKLFAGEKELLESGKGRQDAQLILHSIIGEKTMFYSEEEGRNLSFIEEALMPVNFKKLTGKLKDKGLCQGVNILLYGPPGTGKTETVFQLARKTGRDIRQIDISETKSYWFGESEKIIKKIFEQYKAMVEHSKVAPILFFNEADGVFCRRREIGKSSTGQTENAIQNIILQEMENMKGILIATTNMAHNLDKAFERRFLYKILFEKPDLEARFMIWESRLPEMSSDFIRYISEHFDFTGGQIDNILRKYTMHQVLKDEDPEHKDVVQWCREENMQDEYRKIGFKI